MSFENTEIIMYQSEDGTTKIDVRMENDTVWLTQAQMMALFQSSKANISEHIKHIFQEGELDEKAVVRKLRTTATDGKSYSIKTERQCWGGWAMSFDIRWSKNEFPSQSASLPAPPGWEPLKPLPSGEVARSAGEGGFDCGGDGVGA